MPQKKAAGSNATYVARLRFSILHHACGYIIGAEIQGDSLVIEHEHALANPKAIHPEREQLLRRIPASASLFGSWLVGGAIGINNQMSYRMLDVKLTQSDFATQYTEDFDGNARVIHVRVWDITRFFQAMNGEIVEFELKPRKVPDEVLEFDLSSGYGFQFADETPPHSIAKRVAVQIPTETDHSHD